MPKITSLKELKDRTWVIVGPSCCELRKGRGAWIDSHDFVIRFNNFVLKGYEVDYGRKCNVFVSNFDIRCRKNNEAKVNYAENTCCAFPINERKYLWAGHRDVELVERNPDIIIAPNHEIGLLKKLYNNPSTGITFMWWLYKEIGILPKSQILGISHFLIGDNQIHYYDKMDEHGIKVRLAKAQRNHNPIKEKQIFDIITGATDE